MSSLRGLLARSHLSTDDIHCVLGVTDGDGDLLKLLDWSGLTHLFLCFLLLATGGVQVTECVLDKVSVVCEGINSAVGDWQNISL